jgi:hypothetical protein
VAFQGAKTSTQPVADELKAKSRPNGRLGSALDQAAAVEGVPETRCIKVQGDQDPSLLIVTAWPIRSAFFDAWCAKAWHPCAIHGPLRG